jgi:hypothetical protein
VLAALVVFAALLIMVVLVAEVAAAGAPHTGLEGEPVAEAIAEVEATQTATSPAPHAAARMPTAKLKKYDTTSPPRQATMTTSSPSLLDFAIYFSQKFKPLGITKYDAKQDPVQWLRCYALSIENTGGNNDTKCLYFPFCQDQAPLTWLESLDKYSINKWDQIKDQFTSNFAGAMGRSGTRMDLAMVKQEQGETLRKYMRCFFDKRATVVDVTDKEVIDLFQDGLYHCRTLEDFGRCRPSSITKLKDMITSWADEEDKANAKYDAIRGKSKQNPGGSNNSNRDQGGRNNNNYSGPNRKRKLDNTVAAIQRPAKDNSNKTSGGFKDLLKEKCPWHLEGNHTTEQCYQLDVTMPRQSTFTMWSRQLFKVKAKLSSQLFRFPPTGLLLGLYDYRFKHIAVMEEENHDIITTLQVIRLLQLFGQQELESRTTPFKRREDDMTTPALTTSTSSATTPVTSPTLSPAVDG